MARWTASLRNTFSLSLECSGFDCHRLCQRRKANSKTAASVLLWSFQLSGWSTCRPHSCLTAWLASEQPTKSYHFFWASHQCQVPSLFPNTTCNFVLQTFTPAKISNEPKDGNDEIKQFWMEICNQRIFLWQVTQSHHFRRQSRCQCPHPPPFQCSSPEKCHVENCSCFSCFRLFFVVSIFLFVSGCRFFNFACLVNRMRSPQYSSKHFGSSCARFQDFQISLQIPSPAFRWWIRFTLRYLDTYMMCHG